MCSINNKYVDFVQNVYFKWSNKYRERERDNNNNKTLTIVSLLRIKDTLNGDRITTWHYLVGKSIVL